jgi:Cys-tRNA(Pro)/Cys-tRNA(Cys) deacylase
VTPAIRQLNTKGIPHKVLRYEHTQTHGDYGVDAARQLGVPPEQVFKTLVAETDTHELIVALVPVSGRLHMKRLAAACGARKASMADGAKVEKTTGYVLGGVSPLGQKKHLRTFIDHSASDFETVYVSGGRRGLEIELPAQALAELLEATFATVADTGGL